MAGASSRHVSQKGDQNQNRSGFSPFTTARRFTVAPVAASNMTTSGTSSEISKAMGASVVVGAAVVVVAGASVVVVGASVVSVVVGTVSAAAGSSAGVASATVISVVAGVVSVTAALVTVVAWVVPDAVEAVAVSAVSSPAVVVVVSATAFVVVCSDAFSDGGAVSATLGRVVCPVDVATVSVATVAGGEAVVAEAGVSGSSTPTELSPLPHPAISRAVDTTAMTEPADRRSSRRVCD